MLSIRRRLQVNGKYLQYVNKGYGVDLDINNPNAVGQTNPDTGNPSIRDVNFGPKPGPFTWWSLGAAPDGCHGAGFEWTITTWIAECGQFQIQSGVFIEVSFTVSYDVCEDGLVTITYAGMATIPMSLRANNTIERTVDDEIARIIRPVSVGFIRRMTRQLSPDRATANFTITDKQKEVAPPPDVIDFDMRHRIKQASPMNQMWNCSISGNLRMSPTANKVLAWRRFFYVAVQRMIFVRNHPAFIFANSPKRIKPNVIMGTVEIDEDMLKNQSSFTINFKIIGAPLEVIARVSGLWQPIVNNLNNLPPGGTTWTPQKWTTSLANNAQGMHADANRGL